MVEMMLTRLIIAAVGEPVGRKAYWSEIDIDVGDARKAG